MYRNAWTMDRKLQCERMQISDCLLCWRADVMFPRSVWNILSSSPVRVFFPFCLPVYSITLFFYVLNCLLLLCLKALCYINRLTLPNTDQYSIKFVQNIKRMYFINIKAILKHSQSSCKNTNRCSEANGLPVTVYESGLFSGHSAAKYGWSSAWLHQLRTTNLQAADSDMTLYYSGQQNVVFNCWCKVFCKMFNIYCRSLKFHYTVIVFPEKVFRTKGFFFSSSFCLSFPATWQAINPNIKTCYWLTDFVKEKSESGNKKSQFVQEEKMWCNSSIIINVFNFSQTRTAPVVV